MIQDLHGINIQIGFKAFCNKNKVLFCYHFKIKNANEIIVLAETYVQKLKVNYLSIVLKLLQHSPVSKGLITIMILIMNRCM